MVKGIKLNFLKESIIEIPKSIFIYSIWLSVSRNLNSAPSFPSDRTHIPRFFFVKWLEEIESHVLQKKMLMSIIDLCTKSGI